METNTTNPPTVVDTTATTKYYEINKSTQNESKRKKME